jgi:RimJ/RimL family protein N-acetyltransferase
MESKEDKGDAGEVQLRAVEDDDLPIFFAHQHDPDAIRMAAFPAREWDAFLAHWTRVRANPTNLTQTILYAGQVAGNIGSWEAEGGRDVGYWLGKEYWGRGIATQALTAFLQQIPQRPLYARVVKHNAGSRRVLEKCGFTIYGEDEWEVTPGSAPVPEWILILQPPDAAGPR